MSVWVQLLYGDCGAVLDALPTPAELLAGFDFFRGCEEGEVMSRVEGPMSFPPRKELSTLLMMNDQWMGKTVDLGEKAGEA